MDSLKIVAEGNSDSAKSHARGKLFEKIAAQVLRHSGYEIDRHEPNVTHAGMEIDIEGKARIAGVPLYAECKCYSADVNCEKLQTFYGKYMTRWFHNNKAHGLFLAIPGINSHAMGFYRENCEANVQITVRLLQEPAVLDALVASNIVVAPGIIQNHIPQENGTFGDRVLVCSNRGFFWLQYLIPIGAGIAKSIQIFDSIGNPILDKETQGYLLELMPEAQQFEILCSPNQSHKKPTADIEPMEDVVEVRGSSACFEYQFPAAPQFFVGRQTFLDRIQQFAISVVEKRTSSRSILFEANSGWGKSSLVLAAVNHLNNMGHYALAFDSRSASSPHFVLQAVEHILKRFGDFDGHVTESPVIGGFEGASSAILQVGKQLEPAQKLLFIFFDQFENVFHLLDLLSMLAQLNLKVADVGSNVVLGFSWKTDLVGLTREFPYRWRDTIIDCCEVYHLPPFSEKETNALLDLLSSELHTKLRKDLRFLLSEFSQGYPWLLKKLCAHVKNQRKAGVVQSDMVRGFLNVEQFFLEDLQGLTTAQEESLRRIARLAPVSISDLGEEFSPEIVQSLVDRRLITRVGSKYDIYWDIFRDYLNTGKLPVEEVYILRAQVGSILKALSILRLSPTGFEIPEFKEKAGLSDGAFLNVARDLRLLQLARFTDKMITLSLPDASDDNVLFASVREHLKDRLPRNRCVHHVLKVLRDRGELQIAGLVEIVREEFPYISAISRTWDTYARVLATWLDVADLAILHDSKSKLLRYEAGSQVRDRSLVFARRRSGVMVPSIHFAPVVQVATRVVSAVRQNEPVDWSGIHRSTLYKALSMLEEMKLISRKSQTISVFILCHTFALDPTRRIEIARSAVSQWPVFSAFVTILIERSSSRLSHKELAILLGEKSDLQWKISTAETNAKIMLDWARHLGLAPGIHAYTDRGQFKSEDPQRELPIFEHYDFKRDGE